jgi:hypothetical protein
LPMMTIRARSVLKIRREVWFGSADRGVANDANIAVADAGRGSFGSGRDRR